MGVSGNMPYMFSYTANSYYIETINENHGMTSLYAGDSGWNERSVLHFKSAMVRNPAMKMMLVEEHANQARAMPDDGRWTPTGKDLAYNLNHPPPYPSGDSFISNRHNKRGVISCGDGHVEAVKPSP